MLCPLCQSDNPAQATRCRACGAPLSAHSSPDGASSPDALTAGTLLASAYAVESVLGQGGFGITYRCHDQMLDRAVAVKEFFPAGCRRHNAEVQASRGLAGAAFREARAQFLSEARTLARCHHAGIVGVYAAFEANETAYMVMELLSGQSLAQLITARGGRMNEAESVGIIERVGEALQFVHEQNLLHRDIKPDNIIVCDDGRVMLIDFGTARETVQGQVQGQTVVVTPGYAPLEQYARQAKRGAFTDIYSLAATLYHLLTGQMPPAASDRAMGVMLRPIREFNPNVSASVAHATQSALQMEIAKRPQSVREFLDLLRAPVEEDKAASFYRPQFMGLPFDEDESDEANGEIPAVLTPDALRARQQQPWRSGVTVTDAQPVQLAPPQDFVSRADAYAPAQIGVAGGNVNVQKSSDDASTKILEKMFAGVIVFGVLIVLVGSMGPLGQQRAATPPSYSGPIVTSSVRSSSSFGNNSSNFNANQESLKRQTARQNWDALPALLAVSTEFLPGSKMSVAQTNAPWRGAVEFSADGKRLAYIDAQSVLRVLSMPDRRLLSSLQLDKTRTLVDAMFSPDNQTIAVTEIAKPSGSSYDTSINRVSVWSVRTRKKLGVFATNEKEESVLPQAVSNDGRLLLRTNSLKQNPELFWWSPKSGKRSKSPITSLNVANWGYGVASPDGKNFVVGDRGGSLHWMDLKTGKQKYESIEKKTGADYIRQFGTGNPEINGHLDMPLPVQGIDYSLDGSHLASRNAAEISVFDDKARSTGALLIDGRSGMRFSVSPAGKWVAAQGALPYGSDKNLLWNPKTGQKIRLEAPSNVLLDFGFSPDGQRLYGIFSAGDSQFQMVTWNVNAKPPALFGAPSEIGLQFLRVEVTIHTPAAQTETLIAIATESMIQISPKKGGTSKTLPVGRAAVDELDLAPNGRFLAVRKDDGAVQLWDVQAQKSLFQSEVAGGEGQPDPTFLLRSEDLKNVAFSSDNRLWAYARPNGASSLIELRTLEAVPRLLASFSQKEPVTAIRFSPDNKALICGSGQGLLQWFDVASRKLSDSVESGETVFDIAFGARNLVVMGEKTTRIYQLAANSNKPLQSAIKFKLSPDFDFSRDLYAVLDVSPDGKLLALAQDQSSVQIWDLAAKMKLQDLPKGGQEATLIYGLKFSPDGNQISAFGQKLRERRIVVKTWTRPKSP